ncbi:hypothetical protein [Polaribacter sp. KT 15]|uniref:hypothetical protein n=1 Tax=Polaribacter sp. KT 15 TaxID=1896175 RepID=UPI0009098403|nr:hypothetical protein [Polaribacter sp. KT 15]SHM82759.1 hypothetical protein SAMN05720268_0792 [Polaribacter sp. KT 15]
MKKIVTLILTFSSLSILGQSVESITKKISIKICECIDENVKNSSEIKTEFNRCYDKEFNFIFNIIDSKEHKILIENGNLSKVKNGIIPYLDNNCEKIRKVTTSEIENTAEKASNKKIKSFPINFTEKKWKKIKRWKNEIIALEGEVIEIRESRQKTPYSKLKIGEKEIWVISMIDSKFEKVGNKLRVVGYLFEIAENDSQFERKIHNEKYHILAFGILNTKNKKLAYFPGSENQIKEWINGKIPTSGE